MQGFYFNRYDENYPLRRYNTDLKEVILFGIKEDEYFIQNRIMDTCQHALAKLDTIVTEPKSQEPSLAIKTIIVQQKIQMHFCVIMRCVLSIHQILFIHQQIHSATMKCT